MLSLIHLMQKKVISKWWRSFPSFIPPTLPKSKRAHPRQACSIFFLLLSICIIVTMLAPKVFGMQSFSQWAGIYTDRWCGAWVYSDSLDAADVRSAWIQAGVDDGTVPVWSSPMHNQTTCASWFKKVICGRAVSGGWIVKRAIPYFKREAYLGEYNACDLPEDPSVVWFSHP